LTLNLERAQLLEEIRREDEAAAAVVAPDADEE